MTPEEFAKLSHETSRRLAPKYLPGIEIDPWEKLYPPGQRLAIAVAAEMLTALGVWPPVAEA